LPLTIRQANRFKRDIKRLGKQGRDLSEIQTVIKTLAVENPLDSKYKDHKLTGGWKGYRECHVKPDWLLIYKIDKDELELVRTGSHAELFDM